MNKLDLINLREPFKSLQTQGMVCHQTYKNNNNEWIFPKDVIKINDKFFTIDEKKVFPGRIEKMSKSKKMLLILILSLIHLDLILQDFLFYLILHLKEIWNGQMKVLKEHQDF